MLVALLVRLPGLVDRPLWYDEALAVLLCSKGPLAVLEATISSDHGVAANVHPPGYFMFLWAWGWLFGSATWTWRLPSVLIGWATVALGYRLARATLGTLPGRAAGWILALAPFQVHYSQEVRMYGMLALLLVAAASVFRAALGRGAIWRWAAFAALAAAAQYTHSLASLFLLPLASIPMLQRRWRQLAYTGLSGALALLLYSPWLRQLPAQIARVQRAYWIPPPGVAELVRTLVMYVGGTPLAAYALPVVLFAALWLLLLGGWALARGYQHGDPHAPAAAGAAYLALGPLALMFAASLWQPIYLDRAMLPAGVAFIAWIAWALTSGRLPPRMRWTGGGLLAISCALGLANFYTYRGFPYAPFPELVDHLRSHQVQGEVILHSNKLSAVPAAYYAPDLAQAFLPDQPGSASDTLAEPTRRVLGVQKAADLSSATRGATGVWFIVFDKEVEEYRALGFARHPALSWLQDRFQQQQSISFGELAVHHFSGRARGNSPGEPKPYPAAMRSVALAR